jgi:redox-sensitive bicupin YhaK (pirin superfamily)
VRIDTHRPPRFKSRDENSRDRIRSLRTGSEYVLRMIIRRSAERGYADHGWLRSFHTFSFADYLDPRHMGYFALRVINEDRVQAGRGFGKHGHRDMEIVSYVLEGELGHSDSMGNGSTIRPGDVQRMSAGVGVLHAEMNASKTEEVHFLQIWVIPDRKGHQPGYEQKYFGPEEKRGRLRLVASSDGRDNSVTIHQDAAIYAALIDGAEVVEHTLAPSRAAWVHVARGAVDIDGVRLEAGDAAAIGGGSFRLSGGQGAEVLVFDLSSG